MIARELPSFSTNQMIDAAVIGLGRWGKSLVTAIQGKSPKLRFVHGVSKEPDDVRTFASQHGFRLSTELDDAIANPGVHRTGQERRSSGAADRFTFHVAPTVSCTDPLNPPTARFTVVITGDGLDSSSALQTLLLNLDLDPTSTGRTFASV